MPCRCLACCRISGDCLSKRIFRYERAGLERADEAALHNKDLLAFICCKPVKECLCRIRVVILEYCPPGRRVCQDRVDAFLECVRDHTDFEVAGFRILSCIVSCHGSADPGTLCHERIFAGSEAEDLLIIGAGCQEAGILVSIFIEEADHFSIS